MNVFFLSRIVLLSVGLCARSQKLSLKTTQDPKIIGARFRSARSLVPDLNRKLFCEKYDINRYTMQSWENGLHVSRGKNIEKFIEALAREGVLCTAEWLIDGKGDPARTSQGPSSVSLSHENDALRVEGFDESSFNNYLIDRVMGLSKEMGADIIAHRVSDDAMAPKFLAGDVVLGQKMSFIREMAHQKHCIIKLNEERMVVRKVLVTKEGLLLLAADERVPSFVLSFGSEIYKIVWHLVNQ
jgi:hypothetical protein